MGGLGGVKNGCKRGHGIATRREQFFCFRGVSGVCVWGGGGGGGDTSSASQDQR